VTCLENSTIARRKDGTLWAWGNNGYGCLGININMTYCSSPVQIGSENDWKNIDLFGVYAQFCGFIR